MIGPVPPPGGGVVPPPVMALKVLENCHGDCEVPLHESWAEPPLVAHALSRPSDQKDSSWMPLDLANDSSDWALPVEKTSLLESLTPIIGVLPSIAQSWAEDLVFQIWPSWVCRPWAALMAAWPMSMEPP